MYLATLSKHPHVNSDQHMITFYKIYCLILSRIIMCASLFGSTMSILIDPMTRVDFDTNIITHERNHIIIISS